MLFFSGQTGGGVTPTEPLRNNTLIKKKWPEPREKIIFFSLPEPHETRKKCMLCSVLGQYRSTEKVKNHFWSIWKHNNILKINFDWNFFYAFSIRFRPFFSDKKCKRSGGGGGTQTLRVEMSNPPCGFHQPPEPLCSRFVHNA